MNSVYSTMPSPVGLLTLIADAHALIAILWETEKPGRVKLAANTQMDQNPILRDTKQQLKEYFNGKRRSFDLPLALNGTEFQKSVWLGLLTIPFGQTFSYLGLAQSIGAPTSARAVGMATGKNPLSIVIPCHRLVGSNGKLTGFAGGLAAKAALLKLEKH
jgi:methylated-DNA-[protein]-cysteine S-methyltransferase